MVDWMEKKSLRIIEESLIWQFFSMTRRMKAHSSQIHKLEQMRCALVVWFDFTGLTIPFSWTHHIVKEGKETSKVLLLST
jgi:hypothetical protein